MHTKASECGVKAFVFHIMHLFNVYTGKLMWCESILTAGAPKVMCLTCANGNLTAAHTAHRVA